jgi:hypothetical protein
MTSLEQKEIRGISFSLIRASVIGIATIIFSVLLTYFNLRAGQNRVESSIQEIHMQIETNSKLTDLKLKTLEIEVNRQAVELQALTQRVNAMK